MKLLKKKRIVQKKKTLAESFAQDDVEEMLKDLFFFKDKEDEFLDKNPIIKQQYLQWFKDKIGLSRDLQIHRIKRKN